MRQGVDGSFSPKNCTATILRTAFAITFSLFTCVSASIGVSGSTNQLPPFRRLPTAQAIVKEHLDALNHCDWSRLLAQYPQGVELYLPDGQVVKGRDAVGTLFETIVKPFKDGGLCGVSFRIEESRLVGNTLSVQWQ